MIKFDFESAKDFLGTMDLSVFQEDIKRCHKELTNKTGKGNEFLGWLDIAASIDEGEQKRMLSLAAKIKRNSECLVVIGVGGSYLGARAAIDALKSPNYNLIKKDTPEIYFVGQTLSQTQFSETLEIIGDRDLSLLVVSKSGVTTEPAIAFRLMREHMAKKYSREEMKDRIFAVTGREKGALYCLCADEGYETFAIPGDIGGRYSILTPAGIIPMLVAGIDTDELYRGAKNAYGDFLESDISKNRCYEYALIRHLLYQRDKKIEIFGFYEPRLFGFGEWLKQLFGESHGKELKGVFPVSGNFTTDLHATGQYIQQGERLFFETILFFEEDIKIRVPKEGNDLDELNYLEGKSLAEINKMACLGTKKAHEIGGVPVSLISASALDPYHLGYLIYFFEKACAMSGYLLGINPFNQPGVEEYKKNMFSLLKKPGFENKM